MKYLGFVLLVLSGYVMAEEVYYCSDNTNGASGFHKNKETGQYKRTNFTEQKFKMKLKDNDITIISDSSTWSFSCSSPFRYSSNFELNQKYKYMKSCVHESNIGTLFNFNPDNGRYIWFFGSGYVFQNVDDVITRIGTCTKF